MLDTMTMTKAVAALCGALLIYLLGSWGAETLYHSGSEGHGEVTQAYVIETGVEESTEVEEGPDFTEVLVTADADKGARVFGKCSACHKLEAGANSTGPHLNGIINRAVASVAGFGYSGSLIAVADVWTPDALNGFLENPKKYAPGTKMTFSGLKKVEDRANLIAYLQSIGG